MRTADWYMIAALAAAWTSGYLSGRNTERPRALSPAPSAAPMSGPKCANPYCAIEGDHPATSAAPKEEP